MKEFTLKDMFDFVLKNKKDKTFLGMNDTEILIALREGLLNGILLYSFNDKEEIDGMILAEISKESGTIFVVENLAMSLANLKKFAKKSKETWPEYKLEWLKHGIHKTHDTKKFYKKLRL